MNFNWLNALVGGFCIAALASCQTRQTVADDLLLAQDWKVQSSSSVTSSGAEISTNAVKVEDWYDASVPSTIMGTLTKNGVYADALEGMKYKEIDKSAFDVPWWYRTEFNLPALKDGQHVSLLFDGISYRADVWLNGQQVATKDSLYGPFRQFKVDITQVVKEKNILAVEVFRAQPGEPNIGFVDWNPRPADESMGIFREVRVKIDNEVAMEHSAVRSKVNTTTLKEAWLTVETTLQNLSDEQVNGELKGCLEGQEFSIPVSLEANETKVVKVTPEEAAVLHLQNPRLWWCHNMGNPAMYEMELSFVANGKVVAKNNVDFGVREVKDYFTKEGHRGFLLNGKKVLVRSAGWTDDIFLRDTPETNEIQVKYVRDMNLNSIRFENIWGTSQNVYDLCDRYGLLVLVGWSCHWEWDHYIGSPCDEFGGIKSEADMDLIARSLNDQVLWLRNHPSIIAWFVGSDMIPRPELEKRYIAYLSNIDDRPYVTAAKGIESEISGPSGMKMEGPYEYVAPNYWYDPKAPGGAIGFNTETGIGAQLPVIESIYKMIPKDKLWPLNEVWNYHCTAATECMNTLDILYEVAERRYGKITSLDDFLKKADLLNYEGTRAMFEAFRANIPQATGIVQWMLNSAWPSLYWQLYDYYKVPTAAYYSVKKSNCPKQLIYDYGKKVVVAVNESLETQDLTCRMLIYDLNGKQLVEKQKTITAQPYEVTPVYDVPAIQGNSFLMLQLLDNQGGLITDNVYCLSAQDDVYNWEESSWYQSPISKMADFKALSNMPTAQCGVEATCEKSDDGLRVKVALTNDPTNVGFFVRLSVKDTQGELIVPAFWEDNYLTLAPGETREVDCLLPKAVQAGEAITLTVTGWNVVEQKFSLHLGNLK